MKQRRMELQRYRCRNLKGGVQHNPLQYEPFPISCSNVDKTSAPWETRRLKERLGRSSWGGKKKDSIHAKGTAIICDERG